MTKNRILVVDDDPVIGLSCKRMLGSEGFSVFTVKDGESAIDKISKEEFDLVITDVRLPDVYGLTIVKEAKTVQPQSDVLVITGYPSLDDAKESIRLGAFEYLEKPFTPDFMLNAAKRVFDTRGWVLRKSYVDQFKDYVVCPSELDDKVVYYKDGTWARPLSADVWEIGVDVRHFLAAGQLLFVEHIAGLKAVMSGEPFAKLLSNDGRTGATYEVNSPMTGIIKETNQRANEAISSLLKEYVCESWFIWLAKISPVSTK
ncbi:MAG: response regulator [Nitrospirae bacterium]|nr:MAG: response regulator [Nitrospirota bacterium]